MSKFKIGDILRTADEVIRWDALYFGADPEHLVVRETSDCGVIFTYEPEDMRMFWEDNDFSIATSSQPFIINGALKEYPTLEAAEDGVKAIGNNGVTYEIAQIVKRVTVKRETVVTLEEEL